MILTLALAAVVFLAFVVEATAGFGATVVTVTLASHLMPVPAVLAAFVPVNVVLSAYLVARYHPLVERRILFRRVLPLMGGGMALGMALFHLRDHGWIKTTFAAFVVVLAAVELLRERAQRRRSPVGVNRRPAPATEPLPPAVGSAALVAAGVVHGIFACGGPLLVYVTGRELGDKGTFRATLAAVWLVLNGVLLINYGLAGTLGWGSLETSAALLGSLLLGGLVGEWVHERLPAARFRLAVFGLLLFAGSALLVRSVLER